MQEEIIELIFKLALAIGLFFVLRSLMLWYWKTNEMLENQKEQIRLTEENNQLLKEFLSKKKED